MKSDEKPKRRPPRDLEHRVQCMCVRWFNYAYPKLHGRLFAVPNGGRRDEATGAKLKEEGVIAGVADLILLKRNKQYGALLIEMKYDSPSSRQSASQKQWEQAVTSDGDYKYIICRSLDEFIAEVTAYLNIE